MKKSYIIIIVVLSVAVILGLVIGLSSRGAGLITRGNIGVIEIEGIISSSKKIVRNIKQFAEDPSIQGILVRVDSPGGGVAASQEIYEELRKAKLQKKIVVSMGALAASGGYYVSLPADLIVANPGTITGSIGVIMQFPIFEELMKKIGIEYEVVKSKEHKDIGSPFRRMTEKEKKLLQDVVTDVYEQFVQATCDARHLPRDSVIKFADGRILTGKQAKEIGLVDTLGSFEDAVKILGDMLGIERPNLIYPPKRYSIIQILTEPIENILIPKILFLWH
ncbi:MAG: signal peptide peptidase SppA [candidate division WOR-3 bacterium]|nr:signal peptide peptidase SppA [candidate division WOR-3 bacterium]